MTTERDDAPRGVGGGERSYITASAIEGVSETKTDADFQRNVVDVKFNILTETSAANDLHSSVRDVVIHPLSAWGLVGLKITSTQMSILVTDFTALTLNLLYSIFLHYPCLRGLSHMIYPLIPMNPIKALITVQP